MAEPHSLLRAITYSASPHKFQCGQNFHNLTVVNFSGPDGARASAYSCNMNLDADGEPQAYAPLSKPNLKSRDYLGNAGWKSKEQNEILKKEWEEAVKSLDELEKEMTELTGKLNTATSAPAAKKPVASPEMIALDAKIHKAKVKLQRYYWHEDVSKRPKNYGTIFWHWYGAKSLAPNDAMQKT
jgi:hypothetical protein